MFLFCFIVLDLVPGTAGCFVGDLFFAAHVSLVVMRCCGEENVDVTSFWRSVVEMTVFWW